MYVP
jgi:hypothetical protein